LLNVVSNSFCIFLDSRQMILLSALPNFFNHFVNVMMCASFCERHDVCIIL
jgi:hypothetical protein